jgi:2-aminoadipate transaminase
MPATTPRGQTGSDHPLQELLSSRAARGPRPPYGPATLRYQFGSGNPDPESAPRQELTQAMADVMELDGVDALRYGSLYGYDGLRDLVVHKYRVFEGLEIGRDNVLIANGSNDAISLIVQAFVDEGDPVICEAPTYMTTIQLFRRQGAELIGVEVDDEGMRTDVLAERLAALRREGKRCKLIYTIPSFQNPAGPTLSGARRRELLELAREHNVVVLEDDAYGELRFEGEAPTSLYALDRAGLVCRTGTLSKILGAGVRLGWVVAPEPIVPYLAAFNFGGGVAPLTSRVCTFYLRDNLEPHVAELVEVYRAKRDAMLEELERGLGDTDAWWRRPEGGFFIWLRLPSGTDPRRLAERAAEASVGYTGGPACMPNGGGEEYIRLAYSYESPDEIREGTRLLCKAIKEARRPV